MKKMKMAVRSKIWVEIFGRPILGPGRQDLLRVIDEQGSISKAARILGITYRKAWGQIQFMEKELGLALVSKKTGGIGGGGAILTPEARELLAKYRQLIEGVQKKIDERFQGIFL